MKQFNIFKKLCLPVIAVCGLYGSASAAVTSGTYTVGTGGTYTTLAAAITDLNTSSISGSVVFDILPGTYTSATDWQVSIGAISGASSTNRVTIKAQSAGTVTLSFAGTSSANYIVKLNGASYVTLRGLALTNTDGTNGRVIEFAGAATYDSISGCTLTGPTVSTSADSRSVIYANNTNTMTNNVIYNNAIKNGSHGIYWWTTSSVGSPDNTFSYNTITNSYYSYIYSRYLNNVTIRNNSCSNTSLTSDHYGMYITYPVNGASIKNNTITTTTTGGGGFGIILTYANTGSLTANEAVVEANNVTVNAYYNAYGVASDYMGYRINFKDNVTSTSNLGMYNSAYGIYVYYNVNATVTGNTSTATSTGNYAYAYGNYFYGNCAANTTGTYFNVSNNTFNSYVDNYAYGYPSYAYYCYNMQYNNNVVNGTCGSTGYYLYNYGPLYYCFNSAARNNAYTLTNNGSYGTYNYGACAFNYTSGTQDTLEDNTFNLSSSGYAGIYNFPGYYTVGINNRNTFNMSAPNGAWIYNYSQYGNGGIVKNSKFNMTTGSGGIYGNYNYNYSGYSGTTWFGNTFDMTSTNYGTIYGIGGQNTGNDNFFSNIFTAKTAGSTYMYFNSYGNNLDHKLINNTFHSNSTGSTNYLIYSGGGASYYPGKSIMYNNVFSRSSASSSPLVYVYDTNYHVGDYNLFYTPGTSLFQGPTGTITTLDEWRRKTKRDKNSLVFEPAYRDAAAKDFRPNVASPNVWAMHGRGLHILGDTMDITGATRPRNVTQGVPDLGAYEFVPTSTPPNAIATPASPVASTPQVFTFGQDTIAKINWGASVPATASMKQYSGVKANVVPTAVGRMFFYTTMDAGGYTYPAKPIVYYKDPWLGDIASETNARIAKSSNGGAWQGYNYTNGITDSIMNTLTSAAPLDSLGAYTAVENARIGIRCVVPPSGLKHENVTAITADLKWDAAFFPTGYEVIYKTTKGKPTSGTGALFVTTNATSLVGLTENVTYYIYVRTICGAKDTSDWATDSFKTLITCHVPNVKITALTQTKAVAYWDTVISAYKYEYAVTNSSTPPPFGTTIFTNQITLPLKPGNQYYVHVRSYCKSMYEMSDWGNTAFMTFPTTVENVNSNSIGLEAYPNPVRDVLTVQMYNKIDGEATLSLIDVTGKVVRQMNVTDRKVEMNTNDLAPGFYQLRYNDRTHVDVIKINKQ